MKKTANDKQATLSRQHVVVIGAGPAGFFAAINAARDGTRVTLLDRMPRPALKLLAAGGGRANITNTFSEQEFIARFGRKGRFMTSALRALSRDRLLTLLAEWGVPCHAPDKVHYFPKANRSSAVLEAMLRQVAALRIDLRTNVAVTELLLHDHRICGVRTKNGDLVADAVILATGGAGYTQLGGNRSGYDLARQAGHQIVPIVPGLVGLRTRETWSAACPGITIPESEARIVHCTHARDVWQGDLLFTHHGISGPCILDASATVCRLLLKDPEVLMTLRLTNRQGTSADWRSLLNDWRKAHGKRTMHSLMAGLMPHHLATTLCNAQGIESTMTIARLPKETAERIAGMLEATNVHVVGSEGFERAMVTSGGVSLKEIHPATLGSRVCAGLFFAGEILDLDGPCGGFNLQWAFSSGWLSGNAASNLSDC